MAGFSRDMRIRRRAEFQRVYEQGTRTHGPLFTLFVLQNAGSTPGTKDDGPEAPAKASRLGIAATKKLGGAVVRNRAKRLIREVFRRNKIAPGFDVVVVPKRELLHTSLTVLEADYRTIIERQLGRARRTDGDSRL
jgi:ribonuclease P protein component